VVDPTYSNRYSLASNSDTYINTNSGAFDTNTVDSALHPAQRPRHDSTTLLMLPAPLAAGPQVVNRMMTSSTSTVMGEMARSSEEASSSDLGSASRLIPSSDLSESHDSSASMTTSRQYEPPSPRSSGITLGNIRPGSASPYPNEVYNPFRSSMSSPVVYDDSASYITEGDEQPSALPKGVNRGVRLTDSGPVPGPEGVRRVSRSSRRPTSQVPPQNRYSRPVSGYLPPGAAPPQPGTGTPPPT
jgi:chitin synthase